MGLVHIRCSYNNKYWHKQSENSLWIAPLPDESNENHSDWSCTLFKPIYVNGQDATQGIHFRSKSPNNELCDVCTIIDWETLLVLPKHVAFKGNNGKYLTAAFKEGHQYVHFSSDDIEAPGVSTISNETRLEISKIVVSRDIYNVDYHLLDSRIYNQTMITMATENVVNDSQEPNTVDLKVSYVETKTATWNLSVSLKLGAKLTFETGIPLIIDGKVEL
ncbi:unnamed protein product [Fraxinus pennsylvanica]|uniref:Agglutinin domain-containing protein n=1 Tax=Fraxinus pennsylvanica TaxID=56036 RepID=A0AAD2E6M6_9LAMI|nr:unnamed protein product [Fraxinus pennsylvanica]